MTTKTKNLVLTIITSIIFALLFIPGFYVQKLWVCSWNTTPTGYRFYGYVASSSNDKTVSFIDTFNTFNDVKSVYLILTTAIILSLVVCIILYIVQMVIKNKTNWSIAAFAPIVPTILLSIYTPIMNACCEQKQNEMAYPEYEISTMFYITLILLIGLIAISVISYFVTRKNGIKESISVDVNIPVSTTQELENYSKLLQQGIITQEEFDAKKKQLLDL